MYIHTHIYIYIYIIHISLYIYICVFLKVKLLESCSVNANNAVRVFLGGSYLCLEGKEQVREPVRNTSGTPKQNVKRA